MMRAVLSCRESARLASQAQDGRLPWPRRVALRLHLMMCAGCRAYSRQLRSLTALLRRRARQNHGLLGLPDGLSAEERARIQAALRRSAKDRDTED